jgi:hypothetical protein
VRTTSGGGGGGGGGGKVWVMAVHRDAMEYLYLAVVVILITTFRFAECRTADDIPMTQISGPHRDPFQLELLDIVEPQ